MAQPQAVVSSTAVAATAVAVPQQPLVVGPRYLLVDSGSPLGRSVARRAVKRTIDFAAGLLAVALTSPLMLLISLAIVLDSRGSPLYVHRRVGRFGLGFGVLKFRTMVRDADDRWAEELESNPELAQDWERTRKVRDDPRVTRVGRLLRKYSLDELPQLVNVVLGHMSLVGPRPVVEEELELFGDATPTVLSVRPGVTGLWTVSGRSDVSYEERVALETSYVRGWRLALDLSILVKTVPCVLTGRGAY